MTVEDIDNENQDIEDTEREKDILRKHRDISKWDQMLGDGWEARSRKIEKRIIYHLSWLTSLCKLFGQIISKQ